MWSIVRDILGNGRHEEVEFLDLHHSQSNFTMNKTSMGSMDMGDGGCG